jgi:hypothetical protein
MPLNAYAQQVQRAILETLPQLAPYLGDGQQDSLSIRVPHPRIPTGLLVSTEGDEITICFREWHTHGDLLGGSSPEEHVKAALDFIRRILEDEVQLVISYVNGAFEDAWISDDPAKDEKYSPANEELLIGTWSELAA